MCLGPRTHGEGVWFSTLLEEERKVHRQRWGEREMGPVVRALRMIIPVA